MCKYIINIAIFFLFSSFPNTIQWLTSCENTMHVESVTLIENSSRMCVLSQFPTRRLMVINLYWSQFKKGSYLTRRIRLCKKFVVKMMKRGGFAVIHVKSKGQVGQVSLCSYEIELKMYTSRSFFTPKSVESNEKLHFAWRKWSTLWVKIIKNVTFQLISLQFLITVMCFTIEFVCNSHYSQW